ncbi:MAG: ATP-binding protein [Gammaproteobacteria bacterium]|nr:ATP-binding protein [Gammaproteobacteria bacterium]
MNSQTGIALQLSPQLSSETLTWRPLRHFNYYRSTLALSMILFFYNTEFDSFLGRVNPEAFLTAASLFFISSLVYIYLALKQAPPFETQVILSNTTDILLITMMMHYSGGLSSGLAMLIIINIAATGTFLQSRLSYLFASFATIAVLAEQTNSLLAGVSSASSYSTAGILGIVFFASSILASILSRRARESELIATKKTADLQKLEQLNEHIIHNMRTGILVVTDDGQIRMANNSAEKLLGNINLKLQPNLETTFPALAERLKEWRKQPNMYHNPIHQTRGLPDLQPGFRRLDTSPLHSNETLIFLEDATQLNQRFQQMKLASLGRLTASIAHEIRNPLSAINHAAQLLNESPLNAADAKLTQIITTQVQRLDKVVSNVLDLSRQNPSEPDIILLNDWLQGFKQEFIASHELACHQLQLKFTDDNIEILFDASHLDQVMSNLCDNALLHNKNPSNESMIHLVTGCDKEHEQPYLDVIDNGPGISAELIEQIFDPFFTTSPKGTGLGLFITKEIIETNRGKIRCMTHLPKGCCFRIHFLTAKHPE